MSMMLVTSKLISCFSINFAAIVELIRNAKLLSGMTS